MSSILLHLSSILERVILDHDYLPAYSGYTVLEDKSGCILILDNSFEEDLEDLDDDGGDVADLDYIPLPPSDDEEVEDNNNATPV